MIRVLFVCLGNICRSPTAEIVFHQFVKEMDLDQQIYVDSAGTAGYHIGEKADHRTRRHALDAGYDITHRARQLCRKDFETFDYIVTMDNSNFENVLALAKTEEEEAKVFKFSDFRSGFEHEEVPDPYYADDEAFRLVIDLCRDASKGLIHFISDNVQKK